MALVVEALLALPGEQLVEFVLTFTRTMDDITKRSTKINRQITDQRFRRFLGLDDTKEL